MLPDSLIVRYAHVRGKQKTRCGGGVFQARIYGYALTLTNWSESAFDLPNAKHRFHGRLDASYPDFALEHNTKLAAMQVKASLVFELVLSQMVVTV